MKTKFADEKSEYARLIVKIMNKTLNPAIKYKIILRIEELEKIVKDQDDELIFIVTTKKTNPLQEGVTCAPPKET